MTGSRSGISLRRALKFSDMSEPEERMDSVSVEEPLEIRYRIGQIQEGSAGIVMRTPVHDDWLAVGFLSSEGILRDPKWFLGFYAESGEMGNDNVITVNISDENGIIDGTEYGARLVNSSCGICGKSSIEETFIRTGKIVRSQINVDPETISGLPDRLRSLQMIFSQTGGVHAAGLFSLDGSDIVVAEDVGRHNAVDKVIGYAHMSDVQTDRTILQVSGRSGFEIVQKAFVAGIPIISSVSAPTSLAVDTCEALGITLVSFVRGKSFSIYSHPERIKL